MINETPWEIITDNGAYILTENNRYTMIENNRQ